MIVGPRRRVRVSAVWLAALVVAAGAVAVQAQIQLPGAHNGTAGDGGAAPAGRPRASGGEAAPAISAKPVVIKSPGEDAIVGKTLALDGTKGSMSFEKSGSDLVLSKVTFDGERASQPGTPCQVSVALESPLVAVPAGKPAGALRYALPLKVCPFSIDVLDGAVLVSRPDATCDYAANDCKVSPIGLWGPPAADITPKRDKDLERDRVRLETTMRANFRALLKRAKKDKAAIKAIARDQAAFSSEREMTCRDYQEEATHGFCSTQITEARVLALLSKFGSDLDAEEEKPHRARARNVVAPNKEP